MWLFEWWSGLSRWVRYGVAVAFLVLSTIIYFCGYFWPWGWAIGIVLLFFADLPERL